MKQQLQERQMELTMKINERNRIKRRLESAEQQLKEATATRDRLRAQLTKEQQDIVKLGKFSFSNLINNWTGKWDEKMEKEMAEAELKYNEAEKTVIDLRAETDRLRKAYQNPDDQFIEGDLADF